MSLWQQLAREIDAFTETIRDSLVSCQVRPTELRAELEGRFTFETPVPLEELTGEVTRLLRKYTVHVTHPRYFGLFNPSVRRAGIVADALTALFNLQLATWSSAPAANEIERLTLRCLGKVLGLDPDTLIANFTSGGAEANLSAVLAAIAQRYLDAEEEGLGAIRQRPAIYLSSEGHHSFVKIARMTGLGTAAVRIIPVTERFTFDLEALEHRIEVDVREGWSPLMIVGTAGTTSAGMIDPLPELAEAADAWNAWFHVDAAWGGSAMLSPRLKGVLSGIERADSITWDAHKWLSVPMGAGMFFCRHVMAVKRAFAVSTSYMPPESEGGTVDPYTTTAQWSRRMIGLKVFMTLTELSLPGCGEIIDCQARLGDFLRDRLRGAGWIVVNETPLPVVCFTHADLRAGPRTTTDLLRTIYRRGRVWISDVVLGGRERVLRACITSYRSDESDIECLLEEIEHARRSY